MNLIEQTFIRVIFYFILALEELFPDRNVQNGASRTTIVIFSTVLTETNVLKQRVSRTIFSSLRGEQ